MTTQRHFTHKSSQTRLYRIWQGIRRRCKDIKSKNYGGRGIKVCSEWKEFTTFQTWALAHGYSDELTIERINNNADYTANNCRWATYKEQGNNKRNNILVEYDSKIMTLAEAADYSGLRYPTLLRRLKDGNQNLFRPVHPRTHEVRHG